ncbi:F0F1 ATP synthase subunit B [Polaribacter sp. IC073]|uniref:F0F1 ATP synthase subunit B family protein n=1 Tax=Polaribacter sp. IC073 TaxID=2508540 RepID=UPI0011BD4B0A|nr:F0F1 ATP synthase subunit B [Polaribacter sp. IC073]TXD48641.1 F0F1 ATP synthase subunit B [Polaribacter sp. IC073]
MKIDWFTVIAQVLNFLILVWLLKKFLYKPILNAVNEREKKINDELREADAQKAAAEKEQDTFKNKNADFESKKSALLDKALADANIEKRQLITAARAAAKAIGSNMVKAFKKQQAQDKKEFTQNTQEQVFIITRKALKDIASVSIEKQTTVTFIKHLKVLSTKEKQEFLDAFKTNENAILVKSAFNLIAKQKKEITDAINELLNSKIVLQFKTVPELISGIELSTDGYKMAWSFSEYLNALQKKISTEIKEKDLPQTEKTTHAST